MNIKHLIFCLWVQNTDMIMRQKCGTTGFVFEIQNLSNPFLPFAQDEQFLVLLINV